MKAIEKQVVDFFAGKRIALLGYGKESKSSLKLIRSYFPKMRIDIWDEKALQQKEIPKEKIIRFHTGLKFKKQDYSSFDLVLASPGIPPRKLPASLIKSGKLFGQSELFLRWFGAQTIGITGTKGKSTTTSLTYHILKEGGIEVLLGGNIGVPLFDLIPKIKEKTIVVAELSCHQLNRSSSAPHIAILLNLYEEHLDYYKTPEKYFASKLSIFKNQSETDTLIYNLDDKRIKSFLKQSGTNQKRINYSLKHKKSDLAVEGELLDSELVRGNPFLIKSKLLGKFNQYNILPAIAVAAILKIRKKDILSGLKTFEPLPHRLQYLGKLNGIRFVNDSISTIPQATIAAVKALGNVGSLIVGGYDRKIDYQFLVDFLPKHKISSVVFFDKAGKRIYQELMKARPKYLDKIKTLVTNDFSLAVQFCIDTTQEDYYCLLSPAASSYGIFKNFEERGTAFANSILKLSGHKKFEL